MVCVIWGKLIYRIRSTIEDSRDNSLYWYVFSEILSFGVSDKSPALCMNCPDVFFFLQNERYCSITTNLSVQSEITARGILYSRWRGPGGIVRHCWRLHDIKPRCCMITSFSTFKRSLINNKWDKRIKILNSFQVSPPRQWDGTKDRPCWSLRSTTAPEILWVRKADLWSGNWTEVTSSLLTPARPVTTTSLRQSARPCVWRCIVSWYHKCSFNLSFTEPERRKQLPLIWFIPWHVIFTL